MKNNKITGKIYTIVAAGTLLACGLIYKAVTTYSPAGEITRPYLIGNRIFERKEGIDHVQSKSDLKTEHGNWYEEPKCLEPLCGIQKVYDLRDGAQPKVSLEKNLFGDYRATVHLSKSTLPHEYRAYSRER